MYSAAMIYALTSCIAVVLLLSIGCLVLVWQVVAVQQELQEQANREFLNRIERLVKVVSDNGMEMGKAAAESAAKMAVDIAVALVNPGAGELAREDNLVQDRVTGFETEIQEFIPGIQTDIDTFFGVEKSGETSSEDALETERRYDPDAERYDPMADEWTRQMFYGSGN